VVACYCRERGEWPGTLRRGANGAHAPTGWVGKEWREGSSSKGMGESLYGLLSTCCNLMALQEVARGIVYLVLCLTC
jgi:hypothetical protein